MTNARIQRFVRDGFDRRARSTRALTLILVTLAALVAGGSTASAASDSEGDITWSVVPASAAGPDGRSWVEHTVDPGEELIEHVAVRNFSDREVTFSLTAADGYFTDKGRFTMLNSDEQSVEAGTWLAVDKSVTVAPGETAVVPFTVTVPSDATPGDHAAGIAGSVHATGLSDDGNQVGVESRMGFRVMLRVNGELTPALAVSEVHGSYATSWNMFAPGEAVVTYVAENTGNTHLTFTETSDGVTVERGDLLPGETRSIVLDARRTWPLGPVSITVALDAQVPDQPGLVVAPVERTVTVWAVPWPQLLALLGLVLVVGALLAGRRRNSAKVQQLVEEARLAAYAEMHVAPSGQTVHSPRPQNFIDETSHDK